MNIFKRTRTIPTITKRVGDYLTVNLRVDTGALEVHSAGTDLLYPDVLTQDGVIVNGMFDTTTVNHFAAERMLYIAGEQNSLPLDADMLLASIPFRCDRPGTGAVIHLSGQKAIRRNTSGTYEVLPSEARGAELAVEGEPVAPPPVTGSVLFYIVVEE